jgi:hypothetical protein
MIETGYRARRGLTNAAKIKKVSNYYGDHMQFLWDIYVNATAEC